MTIDESIKNNQPSAIYLIYGSQSYLRRQYVDRLKKAFMPNDDLMNLTVYNENTNISGKKIDPAEYTKTIIETATTLPVFSDYRMVIVENSHLLSKANDALLDYCKAPLSSTILIFNESSVDMRTKTVKALKETALLKECNMPDPVALEKWIQSRIAKEKKHIKRNAYQLFIEYMGVLEYAHNTKSKDPTCDMEYIDKELEKLLSYCMNKEEIEESDIESISTPFSVKNNFALTNSIVSGNKKETLRVYRTLLANNLSPNELFGLISNQLRLNLKVKELMEAGMQKEKIASILGVSPGQVYYLMKTARSFETSRLIRLIDESITLQHNRNIGLIDNQIALELFIHKCVE